MSHRDCKWSRRQRLAQGLFPFLRESLIKERRFKLAILVFCLLLVLCAVWSSPAGRNGVNMAWDSARWGAMRLIGLDPTRADVESALSRRRLAAVSSARDALWQAATHGEPKLREFLRLARMQPDTAVIRWGFLGQVFILSPDVFEPDESGRSYRLRPSTRSIWLIHLTLQNLTCMFLLKDDPEVLAAGQALGGRVVPQSVQTTNSWGCRGPEPDTTAPLRVLVLGDSIMQSPLVGDDETAPVHLQTALEVSTGERVSVLNSGVLGYSAEQYYHTIKHFANGFRPNFVVISLCGNDFGHYGPESWAEGGYWLNQIAQFCRTREIPHLFVPWPGEDMLLGTRDESQYPGMITKLLRGAGQAYFNPLEEFTNEEFRQQIKRRSEGHPVPYSPLYNRHLFGDDHLSPLGCQVWARAVAGRITEILELQRVIRKKGRFPAKISPESRAIETWRSLGGDHG